MRNDRVVTIAALAGLALLLLEARPSAAWFKRMGNLQNTGNVGAVAALNRTSVVDLVEVARIPTRGQVNATPVVGDGLLFVGDGGGSGRFFYVIDLEHQADGVNDYPRLIELDTGATVSTPLIGNGMQSTALYVTVDVPLPGGGYAPERRVYFGANVKPRSFWCLDVDAILAKRAELATQTSGGQEFLCEGAEWPIIVAGIGNVETNDLDAPLPVYNGAPTFLKRGTPANPSDRDLVVTPTIGADCSDGQLWAIDAVDATLKWLYDPVPNFQNPGTPAPAGVGSGGMIWTVPALSADGRHLYVTTGDCVEQPQLGFQAESLVALEPTTGEVAWYQQRRLVDAADFDIGNSPVVVDVPGAEGCNVVVTSDKDGCIYGHSQVRDVPPLEGAVGDPIEAAIDDTIIADTTGYDARIGQQRTLWRTCFVPGSLGGGFNASAVTVSGRTVYAQASGTGGRAPGDDVNGFAVDACSGEFLWTTSSVGSGSGEAAAASGMFFQPTGRRLQVLAEEAGPAKRGQLLATVALSDSGTQGGGGPTIVGDTIYVPVRGGVAIVKVVPPPPGGPHPSLPAPAGTDSFGGPYAVPLATTVERPIMPEDPYDPASPPAGPVETWPSMRGVH